MDWFRRPGTKVHTARLFSLNLLVLVLGTAQAGEARLKNGMIIEGKQVPLQGLTKALAEQSSGPTTIYPILMVDNGKQRFFLPARQVADVHEVSEIAKYERFKLPQKSTGRKLMVQSLGSFEATEFDEFGRRRVMVNTNRGGLAIVQGITEITPHYVTVSGMTHAWEHGLATSSIPPAALDAMIRKVTDAKNPDDRFSIARFWLQAGNYFRSAEELEAIVKDFPELKGTVEEVNVQLQQLQARQLLSELRRRKKAGQHGLAYAAAKAFPTQNMSAEVLREVRALILDFESAREQAEKAVNLMGDLQAKLSDPKQMEAVGRIRSAISESLEVESLDRLDAFLKLSTDATLAPAEKLALAFSGWVLGSANAGTDLDAALRYWNARHLTLEYLRTEEDPARAQLLTELRQIEGFGPRTLLQMIPYLPQPVETQGIVPGRPFRIEIPGKAEGEVLATYHVLLPEAYSRHHKHPLLVTLNSPERPPEKQLEWWGFTQDGKPGQSQRHGYIVVAPEWIDPKLREYDYGVKSHIAVQRVIRDAMQRFSIDSDRVFLSGHGAGGDAAFDIGMSHPDLFVGVIPITGFSDKYCKWYWQNAKSVAWYVVTGELDRDSMARNARDVNRMLRYGYDLIYSEYIGRGYESYYEEIHRLFEWMEFHKRETPPKEVDMKVLRPNDNRFWWVQGNRMPANVTQAAVLSDDGNGKSRVSPMVLNAKITEGNSIYLTSGAEGHTLWLSPDLIDFEKRIVVRQGGRQKFSDFVQPDLSVILEDLRLRGDRQRVYQARIDVP